MSPESPPIRLNLCVASKREPGTIYFTTRPGGAGVRAQYGWLIGIGGDGQIVLNKKFQGTSQDLRCLPSGNILFSQSAQGLLYEVGADGATHRIWHSRDKWAGLTPPAGSVELPINQLHHTVNVLPDGNFLILDAEQRDYEGWPTSTTDRDAPRQKSSIVGDVIKEVTQAGQLVREHRLLDILDPYRITHGSMETYWHKLGFPGAHDWSHANAVAYDVVDDCLVISVRHQDCIVKLGRKDGRIRWILGNPSEWSAPWTQHLLQPEGSRPQGAAGLGVWRVYNAARVRLLSGRRAPAASHRQHHSYLRRHMPSRWHSGWLECRELGLCPHPRSDAR
jgi:hypothetical protein